jgi:hypothetical protein
MATDFLTWANAQNLQADQVRASRIFDKDARVFDMLPALPWMPIQGEGVTVNRVVKDVDSPSAPTTGGYGVVIADVSAEPGTDFTDTGPPDYTPARHGFDPTTTTYYIRELVGDIDVSATIQNILSGQNPQREFQVDAKLTALQYAFAQQFIDGTGTADTDDQFSGLGTIIGNLAGSQTVSYPIAGNRKKTRSIEDLLAVIRDNEGKADFLLMNLDALVSLKDGIREAGAQMDFQPDPLSGRLCPYYDGVRIYINDFIATTSDATSVYAGVLGNDVGLYGIYPEGVGDRGLVVGQPEQHPTADYTVTRLHWYCGLAVFGERALAALEGFVTTTG